MVSRLLTQKLIGLGAVGALLQFFSIQPACAIENRDESERLVQQLQNSISMQYPGASVRMESELHWTRGTLPEEFSKVSVLGETSRGELMFAVTNPDTGHDSSGWVGFSAWVPARIATRRIHPGERLSADMFTTREVNVVSGQGREYRGVILAAETAVNSLEARQTVIEGSFLTSTAVQRVPDIRRGDAVRVQLVSNGLSLSTVGIAEEPAYVDGTVRVMASKTKRQLVGKLLLSGIVEVQL